jgi:hypothetical protein
VDTKTKYLTYLSAASIISVLAAFETALLSLLSSAGGSCILGPFIQEVDMAGVDSLELGSAEAGSTMVGSPEADWEGREGTATSAFDLPVFPFFPVFPPSFFFGFFEASTFESSSSFSNSGAQELCDEKGAAARGEREGG